jgi:hypothetical protein
MDTLIDLRIQVEARRQARLRAEYSRRVERLPDAPLSAAETLEVTPATIRHVRVALRSADEAMTQGLRHLFRFLCEEYLTHSTRRLSEDLLTQQHTATVQAPTHDEPIPLWHIAAALALERKRIKRQALEDATTAVIGSFQKLYYDLWRHWFTAMEGLGYTSPMALWQELSGVDLDDLVKPLETILRDTEDTYRDQMQWHLKRTYGIDLEMARRHDILALFGRDETTDWFPRAELVPCLESWLRDWGWQFEEHVNLRLEQPATVAGGAWCAPFEIPDDIRLAVAPSGGMQGFMQGFREAGKALLLASFPAEAPVELRCLPDPSLLEAQAELCGGLVRTRPWLNVYRHIRQPGDLLRLVHLERLYIVRRYIGKCLYERTLYEDFTLEGKEEAYRDALRKACGFGYPETYYLYDVEPGFATLWQVRGWMLTAHMRTQLQQQYAEEWFREPDALAALGDLWSQSPYQSVETLMEKTGGTMGRVDAVVADLLSEL